MEWNQVVLTKIDLTYTQNNEMQSLKLEALIWREKNDIVVSSLGMFVIVPIKSCVFFRISSLRDRGSCINYVIAANDLGYDDCLTTNSKAQIW